VKIEIFSHFVTALVDIFNRQRHEKARRVIYPETLRAFPKTVAGLLI